MRKIIKIFLTISLILSLAHAQDENDLRGSLRQLEQQILKVKILAQRYQNQRAINLINKAQIEFGVAMNLLQRREYIGARSRFLKAKNLVTQAARIVLFIPAAKLKNELEKLIHDAEIAAHRSDSQEGRYMLNKARAFQRKATQSYNLADYIKGQDYYKIAVFYAQKTIDISEGSITTGRQKNEFEEQLRNVENLYNDIIDSEEKNSDLVELLEKSRSFIQKSKNLYESDEIERAFAQLQIGERLLFRAVDISQDKGTGTNERLENNLVSLKRYLNGIELSLNENSNQNARRILRKANQYFRGARRDFENGNYSGARNKMLLAQRMGTKALRLANPKREEDQERISDRIKEIKSIIELQKNKFNTNENETITFLQHEAEDLLYKSEEEFEKNNIRQSFTYIQLALRIVNRVDKLIREENKERLSYSELEQSIQNLQTKLSGIKNNPRTNMQTKEKINLLFELLQKAQVQLQNQKMDLAAELLNLVQIQLNVLFKSTK